MSSFHTSTYYRWLFSTRPSNISDRKKLIARLRLRQVSKSAREKCDKELTLGELESAVRQSADNKSPGPDGLPMELYKLYEDLLLPKLLDVLHEAVVAEVDHGG